MNGGATVFVISDDAASRQAICELSESMGLLAEPFSEIDEFLHQCEHVSVGCVVTELQVQGASYIQLMDELKKRQVALPAIVIASHPQTSLTVQVMKHGAVTVLDQPYFDRDLRDAIGEAIQVSEAERTNRIGRQIVLQRIASLSDNERRVMELMIDGLANKVIAKRMNVSVRTIESRRHEVFAKMNVRSVAELVRTVVATCAAGTPQPGSVLQPGR